MRKILFGALIGFVIAGALGAGTMLIAQEQRAGSAMQGPLVVLAGLKLEEGADAEAAEKLFKETLIPALKDIKGLKVRVLKGMNMRQREETEYPVAYDYIMQAEFESFAGFWQLRQKQDAGLSEFGDMMKEYAGSPHFSLYTILAQTKGKGAE